MGNIFLHFKPCLARGFHNDTKVSLTGGRRSSLRDWSPLANNRIIRVQTMIAFLGFSGLVISRVQWHQYDSLWVTSRIRRGEAC